MMYNIYGNVTLPIDFDIEADSEEEAIAKAKADLDDYYHLTVNGAYHDSENVKHEYLASLYMD